MNIIILGSSASAISFVDTYRKKNKEDKILIITPEKIKPYFRPMLSHMLGSSEIPSGFYIKKDEFYEENNITINYDEEVTFIDVENNRINTTKETYSYNKLIVAMGSNNFMPPVKGAELDYVCNLKFFKDLENINTKIKSINKITIIGGGLLGVEAAWTLAKSGIKVELLEFSDKVMARQTDIDASNLIIRELKKSGIEVKTKANVVEILGNDKVEGYMLEDGTKNNTDMILYSIGVRPNMNIFKGSTLNVNRGIVVDNNYMTSNKDIYALGDIAEISSMVNGTWTAAMSSGKIAATHLLKEEPKLQSSPQIPVILKALNLDVATIGKIDENLGLIKEETEDRYVRYFVENDILVGAIIIGDKKLANKLVSMINKKIEN